MELEGKQNFLLNILILKLLKDKGKIIDEPELKEFERTTGTLM